MDTSNPVVSGERITVSQFKTEQLMLKRQNYQHLKELVESGERVTAPFVGAETHSVDKAVLDKLEVSSILKVEKGLIQPGDVVAKTEKGCLVSNYHEPGVRQHGPHVSVSRNFSQYRRDRQYLNALLSRIPEASEWISEVVYTGGTKEGFTKRLESWAGRRRQNTTTMLSEWALQSGEILNRCLPFDSALLPDWNQQIDLLLDLIDINRTSNSGPPFFQPKWKCFDKILKVIGDLVKAGNRDEVDNFLEQNMELLLAECKNKEDRYKLEEVLDKTRPYFCFSSPVMLLVSILSQHFCRALKLFYQHGECVNAYGFSWAHGGGNKLWKWIESTEEGQVKYCVYGDDVKLVWRKDGVLYHANPDFKFMDSSVDQNCINVTVDWVVGAFKDKFGDNNFFESIGEVWKTLAGAGPFIIDGTQVYNVEGVLRTGVVGTTLFDTTKSIFGIETLLQAKIDLMDPEAVSKFLLGYGYEVKAGTYQIEVINEGFAPGDQPFEQKFLGSSLISLEDEEEMIPFVPEADLVKLVGNIRQRPKSESSETMVARRRFDTARGYMITAAFHHPRIWDAMCQVIEDTSPMTICMRIQCNDGTGETPELTGWVDDDWKWPSSDGVPTIEFAKDVYREHKKNGAWIDLFPTLKDNLKKYRGNKQYVEPVEVDEKNWSAEVVRDAINEQIAEVRDPSYPPDVQEAPLSSKFRFPKRMIRYKEKASGTREDRIAQVLTDVEEIHHQALELMLIQYGGRFIANYMLEHDWKPTEDGYWTKSEEKATELVTSVWSYNQRMVLHEKNLSTSEPQESSEIKMVDKEPVPDAYTHVYPNTFQDLKGVKKPIDTMDAVSYVSATFINYGSKIETKTSVISQTPHNRVKVELRRMDKNLVIGESVQTSAKEAKKAVCMQIKDLLLAF